MFAIVRTGGKQYRVAAGDRIVVEKIEGDAGAREVVAQAKADKVIVFKKKRRHNYRRKNGHRQQHTILKILSVGDDDGSQREQAALADEPVVPQAASTAVPAETSAE